jgi:hypothetical protein
MRRRPPNFHSYEHGGVATPRWTLIAPALALLVLIRWPLGYETLSPWRAFKRAAVFAVIPPAFWFLMGLLTHSPPPDNEGRDYFFALVGATFGMTLLRFSRRLTGQHKGEEIHTSEAGYSIITWLLPFPASFAEQVIVPGLLGWGGWELAQTDSVDLGWWLMMCAGSYFLLANWEMRNLASRKRAPVDDRVRAQVFSDHIDEHEQQASKAKKRKSKGKSTPLYGAGDAPDVAELGRGRRSRG